MQLTKEALTGLRLPVERVELGDLTGTEDDHVFVRGLSATERDRWEQSCWRGRGAKRTFDGTDARARLIGLCLVNEQGARVFSDAEVKTVGNIRADLAERIFDAGRRLSAIGDQDADDLDARSAPAGSSGSPSSLPSN